MRIYNSDSPVISIREALLTRRVWDLGSGGLVAVLKQ